MALSQGFQIDSKILVVTFQEERKHQTVVEQSIFLRKNWKSVVCRELA